MDRNARRYVFDCALLAARGIDVHLSTTDPGRALAATVQGTLPHLTLSRIDPIEETRVYGAGARAKGAGARR